jgi:hypothetical protein
VHSRLFVVHGKGTKEEDLRTSFGEMGSVEDVRMVRKREGGESGGDSRSGVSYIKFSKASEAAKGEFHDQGNAEWTVIRVHLRGS